MGRRCCKDLCRRINLSFNEHAGFTVELPLLASAEYSNAGRTLDPPTIGVGRNAAGDWDQGALLFDASSVDLTQVESVVLQADRGSFLEYDNNRVPTDVFGLRVDLATLPAERAALLSAMGPPTSSVEDPDNSTSNTPIDLTSMLPTASDSNFIQVYLTPNNTSGNGGVHFSNFRLSLFYREPTLSLATWVTFPQTPAPTAAQQALLQNGILDDGLCIVSANDPISDPMTWRYRVRWFEPWDFNWPSRYRMIAQVVTEEDLPANQGTDRIKSYVFGELEYLDDADAAVIVPYDAGPPEVQAEYRRLKLSVGQHLDGIDTYWDSSFFQHQFTPNVPGGASSGAFTLCRSIIYDNFTLEGELDLFGVPIASYSQLPFGNTDDEGLLCFNGPRTYSLFNDIDPRGMKPDDLLVLIDRTQPNSSAGYRVFRRVSTTNEKLWVVTINARPTHWLEDWTVTGTALQLWGTLSNTSTESRIELFDDSGRTNKVAEYTGAALPLENHSITVAEHAASGISATLTWMAGVVESGTHNFVVNLVDGGLPLATLQDVARGLRNGDVITATETGTLYDALNNTSDLGVTAGEHYRLDDDTAIGDPASWTLVADDPLAFQDKMTFGVDSQTVVSGTALSVVGSVVANSPNGTKVGICVPDRANPSSPEDEQPRFAGGYVEPAQTLPLKKCEKCIDQFSCPCPGESERGFFAKSDTQIDWAARNEVYAGETYTFKSLESTFTRVDICEFTFTDVATYSRMEGATEHTIFLIESRTVRVGQDRESTFFRVDTIITHEFDGQIVLGAALVRVPHGSLDCTNFLIDGTHNVDITSPPHPLLGSPWRIQNA